MNERSSMIDAFLVRSGWAGAVRSLLAGDASFRRYERVELAGKRAVLMDAPPEKEDTRPFVYIAELLSGQGLSAPRLLASDTEQGFLLLEDLGDDLFSRVLSNTPQQEEALYIIAAEVLVELYKTAAKADYSGIAPYDEALLKREYNLLPEWFLPTILDDAQCKKASKEYQKIWQKILKYLPDLRPVLVLRDYHADNLLWLPKRNGVARIGLLDFQDAVIGSPAYDMVSFLEDARRDVHPNTVERVCEVYCKKTGIDKEDFATAYAILGAQRNCKIIGIFCRLAVRDHKPHYLAYLPRVWGHLQHDLQHPALAELEQWVEKYIPAEARGKHA